MDIQYAVKELARSMSAPTEADYEKLKRLGRYLVERPKYVQRFEYQRDVHALNCFTDSNWAQCEATRKSTSGGTIAIGNHIIKSWSKTQSVIALSSGDAEYYALISCASQALGIQSLMGDLGIKLEVRCMTDATTCMAIAARKRPGQNKAHSHT